MKHIIKIELTSNEWEILPFKLKLEIYNFRLSEIIHLPKAIISKLNKNQREFIWFSGTPATAMKISELPKKLLGWKALLSS